MRKREWASELAIEGWGGKEGGNRKERDWDIERGISVSSEDAEKYIRIKVRKNKEEKEVKTVPAIHWNY